MSEARLDRTRDAYPDEVNEKHDRKFIKDLEKEILAQKRVIGSLVRQINSYGHIAMVSNEELHSAPLKVATDTYKDGKSVVLRLLPRG